MRRPDVKGAWASLRSRFAHAKEEVEPVIERGQKHWIARITSNYLEDDADGLASMLAYAAMFSLMPILTVTFLVITMLMEIAPIKNEVLDQIAGDVPPAIENVINQVFTSGSNNRTILGIMTIVSFMLGGSRLYSAMDRTCARVFRAPRRATLKRRALTLVMMPLIPLLLLGATVVAVTATAILALPLEKLVDIEPSREQTLLIYLTSFLLAFAMLFLAYWRIPIDPPPARYAAEAGAFTALLVVLLAQFFPLYVQITGGYSLYGSLFAFVLLILFWLYLVGQIFVIGAEITAFRAGRRDEANMPDAAAVSEATAASPTPVDPV